MRFSAYDVSASRPTAVNVIAGRSGVGKTRAINALLRQRPDGERWAVLVNEQGGTAIDVDLMGNPWDGAGEQLLSYVAGCPCCSASVSFRVALVQLLRQRPDRLLIEPGSVDALRSLLLLLAADGIRAAVDMRAVVVLTEDLPADALETDPWIAAADSVVLVAPLGDRPHDERPHHEPPREEPPGEELDPAAALSACLASLGHRPRFAGVAAPATLPLRVLDGGVVHGGGVAVDGVVVEWGAAQR